MPAKSKAQQKFMGMVHAYKQGELDSPSEEVKKVAGDISDKAATDFAKTKRKDLPEAAERVCAQCQQEHGLQPRRDQTHGMCRRHAYKYLLDMFDGNEAQAKSRLDAMNQNFCPDMGEPGQPRAVGESLANFLLEASSSYDTKSFRRSCELCDKERGVQRQPGESVSHGYCKRHAKDLYGKYMPNYDWDSPSRDWISSKDYEGR